MGFTGFDGSNHLFIPPAVWGAIRDYLQSSGLLKSIRTQDYLFTPLTDRATRLPNIRSEDWSRERPLSMREVSRLLKKYARWASLDPRKLCVHSLRHTAAMLRKQAGDDLEAISTFLGHSSLAVTQIYLHRLEGQSDTSWARVAALLGF